MYRPNNARFSRNRSGSNRGKFHRPFHNGGFSTARKFNGAQRGPAKSKLIGADINIFIKKASDVTTDEAYRPHNSFSDFAVNENLKRNIISHGYTTPTPIQDKAIEPILGGRDLIGLANTGTGKTAAFLIPIIDKIFKNRAEKALIITPTRELAAQINDEFKSFAFGMRIFSTVVIGGASMNRQIWDLKREPNVVIGTPGRLKDLIEQKKLLPRGVLRLARFTATVLKASVSAPCGVLKKTRFKCYWLLM